MAAPEPAFHRRHAAKGQAGAHRRRGVTWFALLFLALLLTLDIVAGDRGLVALLQARREYRELAASVERLKQENSALREQARRLREDPAAIEEIARQHLGLLRPGETLFIVKDVPRPSNPPRE